jgi:Zn-dependent protease with chaperone function
LDFFEAQERSRRSSRWLIVWYALAVVFVIASYCAAAALAWWAASRFSGVPATPPRELYLWVGGVVAVLILSKSGYRLWQLSAGGQAVAWLLGARYVDPFQCTPAERRLINVVEEMAIASGISVPPVYVLEFDDAINALVAGYSPNEAVIIVTRGAVTKLSRDELQGVMGHEFSHILNGDMALNVRLVSVLAGLTQFGDYGEDLVYAAAHANKDLEREQRGAGAAAALFGALIAFIGFPGTLAADFIKSAIARERELLADAASVQFTRNPDGIAGALDSILALRAHTAVRAVQVGQFSHMFFAQAVGRWWGFPTHPPILERIARAHPRFMRDDYRATRHGVRREVAVIDGSGNVVKNLRMDSALAVVATVGRPAGQHVDYAKRLLGRLPSRLRDALHSGAEAEHALFALALEADKGAQEAELKALEARRGPEVKAKVLELHAIVGALAPNHMLTLAELGVPAVKEQRQKARDAFLADLTAVVEADRRVTLREFVLLTLLRQRLREGAGQPIPTQFRRIEEVADDVHVVLSLVSVDQKAFEQGAAVLKLGWPAPLPRAALTTAKVGQALERVRHLAPFAKPGVLKACFEAAAADGSFRLAEAELVRMVAATLDCPVPPLLAAQDPQALAA